MNDFRCDECGKFISFDDFDNGKAKRNCVTPDSHYSGEAFETLCPNHIQEASE